MRSESDIRRMIQVVKCERGGSPHSGRDLMWLRWVLGEPDPDAGPFVEAVAPPKDGLPDRFVARLTGYDRDGYWVAYRLESGRDGVARAGGDAIRVIPCIRDDWESGVVVVVERIDGILVAR